MPVAAPIVSIIIVTADSGEGARECVARALDSSAPVEVVLVDNASHDDVPQAIARDHANDPRVRVLFNDTNLGFGSAVNRGAKLAKSDALLILNPDCMLEPHTIGKLIEVRRAHPDAGVIGAVVCHENDEPDPASCRRDPLLRRALNQLTGRARNAGGDAGREGINVSGPMPDHVVEAENVSGALMLVPR